MKAINSVQWPGRQQIVEHEVNGRKIRILLDVAHTPGKKIVLLDFDRFLESMKICANWAAEKKQGKIFVLMKSALGREIDSQMVHLAEILKPEYFAGSLNIAKDISELEPSGRKENFSCFYPTFLNKELEEQLAEVRSSNRVDLVGPQNFF